MAVARARPRPRLNRTSYSPSGLVRNVWPSGTPSLPTADQVRRTPRRTPAESAVSVTRDPRISRRERGTCPYDPAGCASGGQGCGTGPSWTDNGPQGRTGTAGREVEPAASRGARRARGNHCRRADHASAGRAAARRNEDDAWGMPARSRAARCCCCRSASATQTDGADTRPAVDRADAEHRMHSQNRHTPAHEPSASTIRKQEPVQLRSVTAPRNEGQIPKSGPVSDFEDCPLPGSGSLRQAGKMSARRGGLGGDSQVTPG